MPRSRSAALRASTMLTDQQYADLQAYYNLKTREIGRKVDEIKAELDLARQEQTSMYKRASADLSVDVKDFKAFQADQDLPTHEFLAKEQQRHRLYHNGGLPVGTQQTLFPDKDTVDDQAVARLDGQRTFLRGGDPVPPDYISPIMHQAWMQGWQGEQAKTAESMGRAETFLSERSAPKADETPKDLNAASPEDEETDLDDEAAKLKRSGFMETSGEPCPSCQRTGEHDEGCPEQLRADAAAREGAEVHDNFEASPEELAGQTTRQAVRGAKAGGAELEPVH